MQADPKYCLLLGYIASPIQWARFNKLWKMALNHYGVDEFHAIDFFSLPRRHSRTNPYRDWSDERRLEFLDTVLGIRSHCRVVPIGWAVNVSDFRALTYEQRRFFTGGYLNSHLSVKGVNTPDQRTTLSRKFTTSGAPSRPYLVAFDRFLDDAYQMATGNSLIHVVLDRNDALASGATDYFNRSWVAHNDIVGKQFASIGYQDSRDVPALQAADLYAYAWGRYLTGSVNKDLRHAIGKLTAIKRHLNIADAAYFRQEWEELQEDLAGENAIARIGDGRLEMKFHE